MIALIIISTLLLNGCAHNKSNEIKALKQSTNGINKNTQSKIIDYINEHSKDYEFSGTVLVAEGSNIVLDKAFGMVDYDNNIANTTQTAFEIASITKQFTATAILMLQENKLLNIHERI